MLVYLSGPIGGVPFERAQQDRCEIADILIRELGARCLDPLRGKSAGDKRWVTEVNAKMYVTRDRKDIRQSDVVLLDLRNWNELTWGSAMEMEYAFQHEKPIVVLMREDDSRLGELPIWLHVHATTILFSMTEVVKWFHRYRGDK